jgi:hypothetical protein
MLYKAFGLLWSSRFLPLPELPGVIPVSEKIQQVMIEEADPAGWPELPAHGEADSGLFIGPGQLRLDVEDVGHFWVSDGRRIAWSRWSAEVPDQDVRSFLLGSAMGAVLIQRGMVVLHGNALARNGEAIVCLGASGAGKSTLAYALMHQGWELLADDLVAITPEGAVLPGIPRIKLWEDAAKAFGLDPARLTPTQVGVQKYQLSGEAIRSSRSAVPLKVLYTLPEVPPEARPPGQVCSFTAVASEREAVDILVSNAYRPQFVRGLGQEGTNFLALAALQRRVPLIRLGVPRCLDHLEGMLTNSNLLEPSVASAIPVDTEIPRR